LREFDINLQENKFIWGFIMKNRKIIDVIISIAAIVLVYLCYIGNMIWIEKGPLQQVVNRAHIEMQSLGISLLIGVGVLLAFLVLLKIFKRP
jgi:hypothetical protein